MEYAKFNNGSSLKPEMVSPEKQQVQPQASFPEWINDFNKKCVGICGTKCSEKLDEIMEAYIQEIKEEIAPCEKSPNKAAFIANRMSKMLLFFYLYYSDIKEFFVISQWHENMCTLLSYYYILELKGVYRMYRGKDSDSLVCTRLMNAFWIYLNHNYENILYIILQNHHIGRKHKDILDPIFRKLLINRRHKTLSELEYIGYLLAFKLWKRLYPKEGKKTISEYALTELKAPISFLRNYKKYKFFPAINDKKDVHYQFVTGLVDLETALKEYLELYKNQKKNDFLPVEKTSFISEFCSSFDGIDNTTVDLTDTYVIDKVKNETVVEEIEDDDCIIIEDTVEPPVVQIIPPSPTEIIDLTADEPEQLIMTDSDDEIPTWCKDLIKQSEELKITPPASPIREKPPEEPQAEIDTKEIVTENVSVIQEVIPLAPPLPPSPPPPPPPPPPPSPPREEIPEDNSTITSTSHPDVAQNAADSSVCIPTETFSDNFEHVDSTSNINEPVVKTFVVERTIEDGVVCSEIISELPPENHNDTVSNIDFEQFASQNSQISGKSDNIVDTSRFVSDSELTDILDEDSTNIPETQSLLDKESEGSIISQHEIDDFSSPAIEPMSGKDFANYLAGLGGDLYEEFNKNPEPLVADKKRRIEEHSIRTYTKRTPKFDVIENPVIADPKPEAEAERRVPLNGERVRFESNEIWESICSGTFHLTQKESKLLMPKVCVKKEDPRRWIPDFEKFEVTQETAEDLHPYSHYQLHTKIKNAKKILERQDYLKPKRGEENPRVRVMRRPTPPTGDTPSKDQKLPDVVLGTKRQRGSRNQATTEVKKPKMGRRKTTRPPEESSPAPNPVEKNPETVPWRFSVS